ncbi:MAG: 2'-5' RNA ligase family protein [Candidatus Delongbacteria bacterium]|nr:2'-5' RNA ligase family protein [Candidatus Delongbacteria bacterium]MCG2760032.1 2'-5' RNA ligase family protein [Candidatus Delongbacteria bacterium]
MEASKPGDGGIFIFLPDDITRRIYSWQSQFREYFKMPKPHLTLMYPPYISREMWIKYRKNTVRAARLFKPFNVEFTKTGFFKDPFFLYIAPSYSKELFEMNEKLASICPENIQGLNLEPFIPHVSIGTFATEESALKAQKQLEGFMKETDLKFTVKDIFYTILDDDFRWKIHDIISL